MGIFSKRAKKTTWVDEVEAYSNYAIYLKQPTDKLIEAAVAENEELCQYIWEKMDKEQRQFGFWFMLGMVAGYIQEERMYE